ncbi:MAG TPA: hypothetical protein VJV77_04315 [Casimicrobiaceae bacterium]|nr:hypothetical protein [Casimicrobiaceae bacterium]
MCSLCGALGQGAPWELEGLSGKEARWQRHREAAATASELTRLLAPARIKVTASAESRFRVAFPTGCTEMVASLAEAWHVLDRRNVAIPDPLGD